MSLQLFFLIGSYPCIFYLANGLIAPGKCLEKRSNLLFVHIYIINEVVNDETNIINHRLNQAFCSGYFLLSKRWQKLVEPWSYSRIFLCKILWKSLIFYKSIESKYDSSWWNQFNFFRTVRTDLAFFFLKYQMGRP